ncbi:hypothetical protein Q0812_13155 [Brevundimonas sp. 2R-24]|uniref:Helix-turn-helix domain-containing protein n=1 Tax=Peiella sedimenti TaxID=3061083 RepID=A0ABT8SPG5_9CAUL|nr:hypothetical protein [Caulobacteraceae bacterium XZ-24]
MTPAVERVLPNWPALLDCETAAAYCSMSDETFKAFAAARGVRPVETGHRLLRWRRVDLDRMIDSLPARVKGPANDGGQVDLRDPAEEALRMVQRRAGRRG